MTKGTIIKNISNDYTVITNEEKSFICKPRGIFRKNNIKPLVGDHVTIDVENNIITEIDNRKNSLIRPTVANIDQLIIIASCKGPDFDTNLLDKLICTAEFNRIQPVIILTKLDLLTDDELNTLNPVFEYYKKIGYTVFKNTELEKILNIISNKISVFTGQSGAGKSTLLNKLDSNLNIKTNEISKALGRGKHTTRHTELVNMNNGWVADTPGFSQLEFIDMTPEDIRDNFIEFQELRDKCKFKDCMHKTDHLCAIREALNNGEILESRYDNYMKFISKEKF